MLSTLQVVLSQSTVMEGLCIRYSAVSIINTNNIQPCPPALYCYLLLLSKAIVSNLYLLQDTHDHSIVVYTIGSQTRGHGATEVGTWMRYIMKLIYVGKINQ